ncbi:MAG: hypothetical protein LBQ40_04470 [Clostridiales bacterium]|jgi:hypothetical protein|nr:hypothetical protein [Clostridiales bacterium]
MADFNIELQERKKRISLNGDLDRYIEFDPTDINLVIRLDGAQKRIGAAVGSLADMESEFAEMSDEERTGAVIGRVKEVETLIREQLDYVFDSPVSAVVFGVTNPLSLVDGKSFAQHFLEKVTPFLRKEIEAEYKKIDKHVGKYVQPTD